MCGLYIVVPLICSTDDGWMLEMSAVVESLYGDN